MAVTLWDARARVGGQLESVCFCSGRAATGTQRTLFDFRGCVSVHKCPCRTVDPHVQRVCSKDMATKYNRVARGAQLQTHEAWGTSVTWSSGYTWDVDVRTRSEQNVSLFTSSTKAISHVHFHKLHTRLLGDGNHPLFFLSLEKTLNAS